MRLRPPQIFKGQTAIKDAFNSLIYGYDEPDIIRCNETDTKLIPADILSVVKVINDPLIPIHRFIIEFSKPPSHFNNIASPSAIAEVTNGIIPNP